MQILRTNVWTPREESGHGGGGGMNWEIGIDIYTLICIKQVSNKKTKQTNKNSEENTGVNPHDLGLGNSFLDLAPKAQEKLDKLD